MLDSKDGDDRTAGTLGEREEAVVKLVDADKVDTKLEDEDILVAYLRQECTLASLHLVG